MDIKQEDHVNKRHFHDYHLQRNLLDDDDEIDYDLDDFLSDGDDDGDLDDFEEYFNGNHRSDFDASAKYEFENDGKRRQPFEEKVILFGDEINRSF